MGATGTGPLPEMGRKGDAVVLLVSNVPEIVWRGGIDTTAITNSNGMSAPRGSRPDSKNTCSLCGTRKEGEVIPGT